MRPRCAVYVDVGYLLASAATRATRSSLRRGIDVTYASLIDDLIGFAEQHSGLPLLRVSWYDSGGGSSGAADSVQEGIGALPRVKLRLGRLSFHGEQKGVDLKIGLDLVTHARNRAVDVMYLLSGDDDLTEAVEEAQIQGAEVVVLAVPDADGRAHGVSRYLRREADRVETLPADLLDRSVRRTRRSETTGAGDEATARSVSADEPPAGPAPTPAVMPRRRPSEPRRVDRPIATTGLVYSSETGADAPARPRFPGDEEHVDEEHVEEAVADVAQGVLRSWMHGAADGDRAALGDGRPQIPPDIDRALLMDLSSRLDMSDLSEHLRHVLRAAFWTAYDAGP